MAVIYRDRLVGEAKEIADKGIQKEIAAGNQAVIAFGQQRSILDSAQQQLVLQTNNTLDQIQDNIYRAQRAKRAESAALGYASDVATLRDVAEVQDMVSSELSNVINQTEQGAINIAGQQSAINKAEVQTAQASVLDSYADALIETGVAKQDTGRMVFNGLFGAITGGISGLLGGAAFTNGLKGLYNPTSGIFKKTISGLATLGALGYGANNIGKLVNVGNEYYGTGEELFDAQTGKEISQYLGLGGGLLGAGIGIGDKFLNRKYKTLVDGKKVYDIPDKTTLSNVHASRNKIRDWLRGSPEVVEQVAKKATEEAVDTTLGQVKKGFKQVATRSTKAVSGFTKMNPILLGISVATGAIIGGLSGGMKKKYKLNLDDIRGTDTYKQFQDFGLDTDSVKDIVYNK